MFPCEIQEHVTQPALAVRFRAPVQDLKQHFGRVYSMIMQYITEVGAEYAGAPFAIYRNMDMQNLDVEVGFPVSKAAPTKGEIHSIEIPGGSYAVCHYRGPYDQMASSYTHLAEFAKAKGFVPGHIAYEWYLSEPDVPPQDIRTDIAFPVTRVADKETV